MEFGIFISLWLYKRHVSAIIRKVRTSGFLLATFISPHYQRSYNYYLYIPRQYDTKQLSNTCTVYRSHYLYHPFMSGQSHLAFRFVVPFSSLHVAVPVGSILPCICRRKVYHLQYKTLISSITSYFVRRRIKELLVQLVHNCLYNYLVIYYRVSQWRGC
jgi:hypothetical protein